MKITDTTYAPRRNDKMSEAGPAANRTGAAPGISSSGSTRRIDGRAGRRVGRAIDIGRAHNVYAVEVDGVRYILKSEEKPPPKRGGGKGTHERARRQHGEPASAKAGELRTLNHAQRKSAERLKTFIELKKAGAGSARAEEPSAEAPPEAATPAPIESDERMADAAPAHDADARRGQKRAAGVAPAPAPQPTHMSQQNRMPQKTRRTVFLFFLHLSHSLTSPSCRFKRSVCTTLISWAMSRAGGAGAM